VVVSSPVAVHRLRRDPRVVAGGGVTAPRRCGLDRGRVGGQGGAPGGVRRIAAELARPAETVRGWLRRFGERAEAVRSVFTVWLRAVDADPVMPEAAGSG
jgi:hypothetical protein